MLKLIVVAAAAALLAPVAAMPAMAATAHNSQAGSFGPTSNICAATPYFRDGGCLSSYFEDAGNDVLPHPDVLYRSRAQPRYRVLPPSDD